MCGCLLPEAIAARPIHPKLGASSPPVVLVMTRAWYAGATATCSDPDGSSSTIRLVCCRRKATSESNLAGGGGAAGWLAGLHAAVRQDSPNIANCFLHTANFRILITGGSAAT